MRAGQNVVAIAIGIQRIFHHVMPGGALHMHEQLSGERRQIESLPQLGTVDGNQSIGRRHFRRPVCEYPASFIKENAANAVSPAAVGGPIIDSGQTRVMARSVAKESEIGREIEIGKISRAIGKHALRQPQKIERQDLRACRKLPQVTFQGFTIERGNQHRGRVAPGKFRNRTRLMAAKNASDLLGILNKKSGNVDAIEGEESIKTRQQLLRIVDCHRTCRLNSRQQIARRFCRQRMRDGFVKSIASGRIAESFDSQRHPPFGPKRLKNALTRWRNCSRRTTDLLVTQFS